jgi:hypothetical protein
MSNLNIKHKNFIKKILLNIKENFADDIKLELFEPLYIELKNIILPHYLIFIILLLILILLNISLIIMITNQKK